MAALPSQHPAVVLAPVGRANRAAVAALTVGDAQRHFVATNRESLAEADADCDARPRVVMFGDQPVGFLMYDASDADDVRIYRLMIDQAWQGRGLGRAALDAVLREIAALGAICRISIVYEPDNEAARRLYRTAGFVEEGLDEDGEMVAALILNAGPAAGV